MLDRTVRHDGMDGGYILTLRKNRNFVILLSGQLVSTVGNNLFGIALPWYVYELTNSKADLALTGLAQTLPALAGLFAGVMVDRWRKRSTMIGSDAIRALLSFVLFGAVLFHWPFWTLLLMVLGLQVVGQFFNPASGALFPLLVDPEDITAGSGVLQSSNATAQLVGTVSGGALMAALGAPMLFLLDGVSFLASVVSLFFIRVKERTVKFMGGSVVASTLETATTGPSNAADGNVPGKPYIREFLEDWLAGVKFMGQSKFLILIVLAALVTNGALAPFDISITAWVKGPMRGNAMDLGIILGGFFVGTIVGGVLLGIVSKRIPLRALLVSGLIGIGICSGSFGLFHSVIPETGLSLIAGFAAGTLNGSLSATFINLIPESMRGRVFGLFGALATLATPLGMAVFGVLMVHLPLPVIFVLIGALCTLGGLSLLLPIPDDKERLIEAASSVSQ